MKLLQLVAHPIMFWACFMWARCTHREVEMEFQSSHTLGTPRLSAVTHNTQRAPDRVVSRTKKSRLRVSLPSKYGC